MGFGKSLKRAVGGLAGGSSLGGALLGGVIGGGFGSVGTVFGAQMGTRWARDYKQAMDSGDTAGAAKIEEEFALTPEGETAKLYASLTPEQKKDLLLNNPNIVTPEGSQSYNPFTNTVSLNESDFTKSERLRQEDLASQLSSSLSGDFSNNGQAIQDATFQRGKAQIDPIVKQQKRDLAQQLADQGIPAGSEQYNEAMNRMDDSIARQYTDLSQASIQTGEQVRESRFNEISSLLGRSQVGAGTSFGGYTPNYNGIDLAGFAQQSQMQKNQLSFMGEQAKKERSATRTNALIGAVGSVGSSGIAAAFSDITLKENIEPTGISPSGIPIYEFDYKDKAHGEGRYSGVMAQDLEKTHPDAVLFGADGFKMVDYSQVDVEFRRVK